MQARHWTAVALATACLLLVVILAVNNRNTSEKTVHKTTAPTAQNYSWSALMQDAAQEFDLPPSVVNTDSILESKALHPEDTALINQALEFFRNNRYYIPAARYQVYKAKAIDQSFAWMNAGTEIYFLAANEADSALRDFFMQEAVACFNQVLESDEQNQTAMLYKGLALTDKRETMMEGVPLLLSVVRKDSNNIPANYTLALLAIESNQLEKALLRFEKLISLQPSNPEYYFQTGRVYEMMGEREKALANYRRSYELTEDEGSRAVLEKIINNLN